MQVLLAFGHDGLIRNKPKSDPNKSKLIFLCRFYKFLGITASFEINPNLLLAIRNVHFQKVLLAFGYYGLIRNKPQSDPNKSKLLFSCRFYYFLGITASFEINPNLLLAIRNVYFHRLAPPRLYSLIWAPLLESLFSH